MTSAESSPGTYLLLLACERVVRLSIGRLGVMTTRPGYYLYVGSAFGPGGIRARIGHHAKTAAHPHWHLDYLRPLTRPRAVWTAACNREHGWAAVFQELPDATIPG